jgi:hypothetical protein
MTENDGFTELVPIVDGTEGTGAGPLESLVAQGATMMQTKTAYHTAVAVQKPRSLDKIVLKVLNECDYAGDEFYYSWPVKDKATGRTKQVEGASIGAAMALVREWGNCVVDVQVDDLGSHLLFTPSFIDLETGSTIRRSFKYHPTAAPGRYDAERWADMQFQLAQSKAIRNVVVAAMPRWLIKRMIDKAKKAELAIIDRVGIVEARQRAIDFFLKAGIEEARLVAYFHGKAREEWDSEDVALLRNYARQHKDGEIDLERIFPAVAEEKKAEKAAPADASQEQKAPDFATPSQVKSLGGLLVARQADQRYCRDIKELIRDGMTYEAAKSAIDALTKEEPDWPAVDTALGLTPEAEPKGKKGKQGSLV